MKKFSWLWLLAMGLVFSNAWSSCVNVPNRYQVDPVAWAKFDLTLQRAIDSAQGDPTIEWPVMIILAPAREATATAAGTPASQVDRSQMAEERQTAFEQETADLVAELEKLNAKEIQLFWINRTISARMTLPALEAVGKREEVKQIVFAARQKVIATPEE